jgi:hypothetical protein
MGKTDDLVARIREAFPVGGVPEPNDLVSHTCESCEDLRASFGGLTWTSVSGRVLDQTAERIALFSPRAFRYYLPAFMCHAVAYPERPGVGPTRTLDFTVQSLCDEALPSDEWWSERMPQLTRAQRGAVRAFLEWVEACLTSDKAEDRMRGLAREGLEKYWRTAPDRVNS